MILNNLGPVLWLLAFASVPKFNLVLLVMVVVLPHN